MIVVVGISHKTAPIEVRERVALATDALPEVLSGLMASEPVTECFVLSTCNRVEIVAVSSNNLPEPTKAAASSVLAARFSGVESYLYRYSGHQAVSHLFRVAASLDSLVLGEPQILGQLKSAFDLARKHGSVGGRLYRAFNHAVKTAKRVRSETTIGVGQVSVPSVAVDLARQIFGDLSGKGAALIGSGEMGESVAKLLHQGGASLEVVGRNQERVGVLAEQLAGTPRDLSEVRQVLEQVDVVVSTTSAAGIVVDYDAVAKARRKRRGRSLFLIDLAVPRDIDPRVDDLDGVFLYNIDDLSQIVAETLSSRQREAERAEQIVAGEVENYERHASAQQVTPTVVALRTSIREVLDAELERSFKGRLKHLSQTDRDALSRMLDAAINKILHHPTRRLRTLAADAPSGAELEQFLSVLTDLFGIESDAALENSAVVDHLGNSGESDTESAQATSDDAADESARRGIG